MASLLFSAALFISALLLFSVQPLVAKMLLPYLGGSPSVWNTCVVFFQVMLLGGYLYSHMLPGKIGIRKHAVLHLLLLGVAALLLPIGVSPKAIESLSETSSAPLWLLVTLLTTVGLPFFVLSTTAPLLQSWFSNTAHRRAHDPYFLYAASNFGSLLALLSYPLLVEPNLKVRTQSLIWSVVYALAFALIALCALVAIRTRPKAVEERLTKDTGYVVTWSKRLRWVVLALVPSSLMLGVTTYISTDLAPVPLFWVVPLSLYLLTFIIQFSGRQPILRLPGRFLLPIFALPVVFSLATGATRPLPFFFPAHLLFFFLACLVCHGQLASDRPPANHLTEFYLWISIGGALGGLFNALVAPVIFRKIVEYPLMVAVACCLRPTEKQGTRKDIVAPLLILLCLSLTLIVLQWMDARSHVFLVALVASLIAAYFLVERPVRFGSAIVSVFIAAAHLSGRATSQVWVRNRFSIHSGCTLPSGIWKDNYYRAKFLWTIRGDKRPTRHRSLPNARHNPARPAVYRFGAAMRTSELLP